MCLNTLVGALAAYGLAGLRPDAWAVAQFALLIVLQSLVAIQVMILSVFIMPNQARSALRIPCSPGLFLLLLSRNDIQPTVTSISTNNPVGISVRPFFHALTMRQCPSCVWAGGLPGYESLCINNTQPGAGEPWSCITAKVRSTAYVCGVQVDLAGNVSTGSVTVAMLPPASDTHIMGGLANGQEEGAPMFAAGQIALATCAGRTWRASC